MCYRATACPSWKRPWSCWGGLRWTVQRWWKSERLMIRLPELILLCVVSWEEGSRTLNCERDSASETRLIGTWTLKRFRGHWKKKRLDKPKRHQRWEGQRVKQISKAPGSGGLPGGEANIHILIAHKPVSLCILANISSSEPFGLIVHLLSSISY